MAQLVHVFVQVLPSEMTMKNPAIAMCSCGLSFSAVPPAKDAPAAPSPWPGLVQHIAASNT